MRFRRIEHAIVDSTSERAFAALARGEARDGDVHVAVGQTAGRGRRGRAWHSAPGEGLYASLVLLPPPPGWPPAAATIAGGLAALEAAAAGLPAGALRLDWPNDVVDARGAKLAGVLVETRGLDPARPHYVLGVGVNVLQRAFPPELAAERAVTSLARLGSAATPAEVLERLLAALERRLAAIDGDPASLARDYLAATGLAGGRVALEAGDGRREGELAALDLARGVALRGAHGELAWTPLELVRALDRA
jgi:BirA family biotin operon repressor/biotin-[acetyl-CoA-carboxylase] ligase